MTINKPEALYIHVPFCHSICYYCDFCHVVYSPKIAHDWLLSLQKELNHVGINPRIKTIYVGGGTPTALHDEELDQLLSLFDSYREVEEYTVEVNPEGFHETKAQILYAHGVNRLSIGYQTSSKDLLTRIGRHHTYEDVKETMRLCKKYGISNISLDIMYGLPNQSLQDVKQAIDDALALEPMHLSLYSLTIEENTVFGRQGIQPMDEDLEADMYDFICAYLPTQGFHQYEISNFALLGKESKHNLAYWNYEDFYGISCGASGKENHIRYDKPQSVKAYCENPYERTEIPLSNEDEMFEMVMMGLRKVEGISLEMFNERYGISLLTYYATSIEEEVKRGNLEVVDGYLRCTKKGFPILNSILVSFL